MGGHEFLFNKPVPMSGGSREGARGARVPTLFLDQTEAQKAEKIILRPRPYLRGLDNRCPPPPSPYRKVWIRHYPSVTD